MKVLIDIPTQRIKDLLCTGMESGIYADFKIVGYGSSTEGITYPHFEAPFCGVPILLKDKYGDSDKTYVLGLNAINRGLTIMAEKYPQHMADFLNENEDVVTGTVFIQCALLGEIVYA